MDICRPFPGKPWIYWPYCWPSCAWISNYCVCKSIIIKIIVCIMLIKAYTINKTENDKWMPFN